MGLNAQLQALTVPSGTEFPGTVQALLVLIAEYEEIIGLSDFNGINYGSVEPDADNRDKPWFKTDGSGNPIGWFSWNGSAWTEIPLTVPNGPTSERPTTGSVGQLYEDTTIGATLKWNGTTWVTQAGTIGDVKEVKFATLAEALTNNPGWEHDTDSVNMVIGGASDGTGADELVYGVEVGELAHTLTIGELPNDAVNLLSGWGIFPGAFQNGSQAPGVYPITTGLGDANTKTTAPINPNTQTGFSLLQPTMAYWRLTKTS